MRDGQACGDPSDSLAMAASLAQLRTLEAQNGWQRLGASGAALEERTRAALKKAGRDYTLQRIGSMFCLYFTSERVVDLAAAKRSDIASFNRFFHGCRERGVYFAPSQFEAGFLSLAHTDEDLERTATVVEEVLTAL